MSALKQISEPASRQEQHRSIASGIADKVAMSRGIVLPLGGQNKVYQKQNAIIQRKPGEDEEFPVQRMPIGNQNNALQAFPPVHSSYAHSGHGKLPFIQAKLSVNAPGDQYEQEADTMADKVMRMKGPFSPSTHHGTVNVQRKCAACDEEEKHVHRKENSGAEVQADSGLDSYVSSLNSSGQALSESSRNFFEPRFGQDFSNVRVHTDSGAAKSAKFINALAYTTGNNIVFNEGQYAPGSESGQRLMAHELTHVVQQKSGVNSGIQRMKDCPPHLNDSEAVPSGFKDYYGNTTFFHCGFRTILEDRTPTPTDPMNECVYDHSGVLVTDDHKYANCKGTPDQYNAKTDKWNHTWNDSGGIRKAGGPAFSASMGYIKDRVVDAAERPFMDFANWMDRGVKGIYGIPY
jgi:hypothetical protein